MELPYSGDGYCKRVVSKTSRRVPKAQWVKERRTYICMPPESYAMIKNQFYKQCYNSKCKEALDSVGQILKTIDAGVKAFDGVK